MAKLKEKPHPLSAADEIARRARIGTTPPMMRFGPGICAACGINHGVQTCAEFRKDLDSVADAVLRYRPKPKTKPARRRKKQMETARRNDHDPTGEIGFVAAAKRRKKSG